VMIRNEVLRYLPWLMVLFFIGMAFQWERHLPKLPLLGGFSLKLQSWLKGRPRTQAGLILGLATPLLPCGPLYFAIAASMLAGSSLRGLEFMLCFCLGTIPLLWLAQAQFQWLHSRLTPRSMGRLRLGLALCSALLIAWRLRSTLGFDGPGLENFICCFG